jgi:hypothetical protein
MSMEWKRDVMDRAEAAMWKRRQEEREAVEALFSDDDALVAFRAKEAKRAKRKEPLEEFAAMAIVVIAVALMILIARVSE